MFVNLVSQYVTYLTYILLVPVRHRPLISVHTPGCWSTAPHAVVLTLMRECYYCVYLYLYLSIHCVCLTKTVKYNLYYSL